MDNPTYGPSPLRGLIKEMRAREARARYLATFDAIGWAMDCEILFGRKPSEDEQKERFEKVLANYMKPGLMWPGLDF